MYAYIKLKNGEFIEIFDLQFVKQTNGLKPITEIKDFSSFILSNSKQYVFVGKTMLSIQGDGIEYVSFKKQ